MTVASSKIKLFIIIRDMGDTWCYWIESQQGKTSFWPHKGGTDELVEYRHESHCRAVAEMWAHRLDAQVVVYDGDIL